MAFLAGIFGFARAGSPASVLTTTLGWASSLLFGRVPQSRQVVLALITFGSVVWAALVDRRRPARRRDVPRGRVPAPDVDRRGWIRLAMLIGALIVPAVVGVATLFVLEPANRPRGRALVGQVFARLPALRRRSRSPS